MSHTNNQLEKLATAEKWIPPEFSRFGEPLALQMRDFLFRDPTANMGKNPEQWRESGAVIVIQKKKVNFTALGATPAIESLNIGGGKNALVFSRFATIRLDSPAQATLPNSLADYFTVQIERDDNLIEVPTLPISHHFGTIPGWPATPAFPEFWLGNLKRIFTVTNNWAGNAATTIDLSFEVATLNTGR
jgi:hypothetical protein